MTNTYLKIFKDENNALDRMVLKNRSCRDAKNLKDVFCVVDHPEGFAVVDLNTAIELGGSYRWSYI